MDDKCKDLSIWKWILLTAAICVIGTLVFSLLMHFKLFSFMDTLMYRGIVVIVLTAALLTAGLVAYRKLKGRISAKDIFSSIVVFMCLELVFFTLVPVTVERSVSVYTLSLMEQGREGNGYTKEEIRDRFVSQYVDEFDAFEKRFNEQLETGTVELRTDAEGKEKYVLTDKGSFVVDMFRFVGSVFSTDERLLYPDGRGE